jgi:hypothetical protein
LDHSLLVIENDVELVVGALHAEDRSSRGTRRSTYRVARLAVGTVKADIASDHLAQMHREILIMLYTGPSCKETLGKRRIPTRLLLVLSVAVLNLI